MGSVTKTRRHNRIGLIIFVIVAVAACLALGYWQLSRYSSSAGTAQNLGYALQWPLFAAFFVYAYRRFVRLEAEAAADETGPTGASAVAATESVDSAAIGPAATPRTEQRAHAPVTEIPAHLLPRRASAAAEATSSDDSALAEYNRYLAQLRDQDEEDSGR